MRQPTKPKPQAYVEVARVLHIALMLDEELRSMMQPRVAMREVRGQIIWASPDILAVAERIAARTEG